MDAGGQVRGGRVTGGRVAAAGAAVAAAALTGLVLLATHPQPRPGGPALPLAAALWGVFAAGAWLVRRVPARWAVALILLGGIAVQAAALTAPPRGSDDLYRYIWDGRVQAAGIDPYRYVPAAHQVAGLRDRFLWPERAPHCVQAGTRARAPGGEVLAGGCTRINRPAVPTIYPPAAEAYFLAVAEASPAGSGTRPVQAGAALCAMAVTGLLLAALRSLGRDPRLAVLWAWCPAVALEAGNNAHVDVLAAVLAAAALWALARAGRGRAVAGGVLLGLAVAAKLTPVLLAPATARRRPVAVAAAATAAAGAVYLPHVLADGGRVIGFLPGYLHQEGYATGSRFALISLVVPGRWATLAAVAALSAVALAVLARPDPDRPWRGALVMTGAALVVTDPPFPWYSLLLVMLAGFDGRWEWLALAAARYLVPGYPAAFPPVTAVTAERIGYGLALAVIAAGWLARRRGRSARPGHGHLTQLGPVVLRDGRVDDPRRLGQVRR